MMTDAEKTPAEWAAELRVLAANLRTVRDAALEAEVAFEKVRMRAERWHANRCLAPRYPPTTLAWTSGPNGRGGSSPAAEAPAPDAVSWPDLRRRRQGLPAHHGVR